MAQAGMAEALARGVAILRSRVQVPELPAWFSTLNFAQARAYADPWAVADYAQELRRAESQCRLRAAGRVAYGARWKLADADSRVPPIPSWAADDDDAQKRMVLALGRLALGAAIEAALAEQALDGCAPGHRSADDDVDTPRLYQDAFLVSVWTSAHAQYVSYIQSGVEEPPEPSLLSIPNAASEIDFSELYSRRFCSRQCPKPAMPLLQVLMRCTNPGSRGWNTLLDSALQESMATRSVVTNAMVIALSGMHPFLHPALRPPWNTRMRASRVAQHKLTDSDARNLLVDSAAATKEAVRRLLASTVAAVPAMQSAFAHVGHPVGLLKSPPYDMPHRGMEGAMAAFVQVGVRFAECNAANPLPYAATVNNVFAHHSTSNDTDERAMDWDPPWLGKGTASIHQKIPLVSVASDLWAVSFRANFLVFWAHCMASGVRASRLDLVQHRAIHGLNAATKLTLSLPLKKQMQAQRAALNEPCAGLLTMEEASQMLGIPGIKGSSSNGGAKGSQDALKALSAAGSEAMARLLVFARAAWVSEELLIIELGEHTKRMQTKALHYRLGCAYDATHARAENLPIHSTHLHACVECHRVANAFSTDGGKPGHTFNELGVSSSMLCTVCTGDAAGCTHIRCAKRSSAALRTAVTFEEKMVAREIEAENVDPVAVRSMLGENRSNDKALTVATVANSEWDAGSSDLGGIAARVRRDAKNALEQRATALACGEQPMLCVNIVGRAIRLWNEWYALCSLCGCMLRVMPHNRYGAEICCCKCDAQMLGFPAPVPSEQQATICRFCGTEDSERRATRWKVIKAPLDVAGPNKDLPPPMRSVVYCPKHWRTWLMSAHRVLQTRVILSHIAHNAKPVFLNNEKRVGAEELGFEVQPHGRKRRKTKSKAPADGEVGVVDDD